MATTIHDFPHHGEHLATDGKQAEMTISLLALFAIAILLMTLALLG